MTTLPRRPPPDLVARPRVHEDGDLSDMLSELRILLPGAQMLTAFLIILPFNSGARDYLDDARLTLPLHFFLGADQSGAAERPGGPA